MRIKSRFYGWMTVFFAAWLMPAASAWGEDPINGIDGPPGSKSADAAGYGKDIENWVAFAENFQDSCTTEGLTKKSKSKTLESRQTARDLEDLQRDKARDAELTTRKADLDKQVAALNEALNEKEAFPAVCKHYCSHTTGAADTDLKIDACAFSDPMLVAVGLEVAPNDMYALKNLIIDKMEKTERSGFAFEDAIEAGTRVTQAGIPGAADIVGGSVTALLQRGLGALARVIADRAKREAIGWLLDDVASELCGDDLENLKGELGDLEVEIKAKKALPATDSSTDEVERLTDEVVRLRARDKQNNDPLDRIARSELRNHWMSNLCALAREDRLDHYGAGAALLEALQGALENDVRGWPGVLAGIGLSEFHWVNRAQPATTSQPEPPQTLAMAECVDTWADDRECNDQCNVPIDPQGCDAKCKTCVDECQRCTEADELRTEGERFVARLLEGRDPVLATRDLGTAVSSSIVPKTGEVNDAPLELLACGASLPAEIALLEPKFDKLGIDRPLTAAILAGLIRAPACWELTGKGYDSNFECEDALARKNYGHPRERISTILRLAKQAQTLERVQVEYEVLRQAVANLEAARKRNSQGDARAREIFLATIGVSDASLASADALLVAVARFSDITETFPALEKVYGKDKAQQLQDDIEKIRERIAELRDLLTTLQGFGTGEYSKAITASSKLMLEQLDQVCESDTTSREKCRARVDAVGRHIGTITAILTAENVEDMAAALDAAANPPGGWRSKAMPGNLTVSLTAYPGLLAGGEVRWGQYGAIRERGGVYGQMPTLAMPFGLDVAWGCKTCRRDWAGGLFFPLIDPAAFLLYDVDAGGKLPGPRPVTALSPGIAVRLGIPETPLAILLSATYRPQLRSWEATVSGPGANVVQFGLSVAVDVTLWKIFARGK